MYYTNIDGIDNNFDIETFSKGNNNRKVTIGDLELFYSYRTVIAFNRAHWPTVIAQNQWGSTTGRHLNDVNPDKSIRLPYKEFKQQLKELLEELGL